MKVNRERCDERHLRLLRELALDLPRLVCLDHVAFLDVLEVLDRDAAFEALLDLARIVLEALERSDLAVVDDRSLANEANVGGADDLALSDVAARDRADPGGPEDLADLGHAQGLLDLFGRQHALHRGP